MRVQRTPLFLRSGMHAKSMLQIFLQNELSGFEELSGIPGTIGGAIKMNAGAHGKEMKDIVKNIKCIDYQGNEKTITKQKAVHENPSFMGCLVFCSHPSRRRIFLFIIFSGYVRLFHVKQFV